MNFEPDPRSKRPRGLPASRHREYRASAPSRPDVHLYAERRQVLLASESRSAVPMDEWIACKDKVLIPGDVVRWQRAVFEQRGGKWKKIGLVEMTGQVDAEDGKWLTLTRAKPMTRLAVSHVVLVAAADRPPHSTCVPFADRRLRRVSNAPSRVALRPPPDSSSRNDGPSSPSPLGVGDPAGPTKLHSWRAASFNATFSRVATSRDLTFRARWRDARKIPLPSRKQLFLRGRALCRLSTHGRRGGLTKPQVLVYQKASLHDAGITDCRATAEVDT